MKTELKGCVSGVLDAIMRHPCSVFISLVLVFHWSILNLGIALIVYFVDLFLHLIVARLYDLKFVMQLNELLKKHSECRFEKYSYEDIVGETDFKDDLDRILWPYDTTPSFGDIFLVSKNDPENEFRRMVSFPFRNFRAITLVTESPLNKSYANQFRLFHEIGHWVHADFRFWMSKSFTLISFLFLVVLGIQFIPNPWVLSLFFLIASWWLIQNYKLYEFTQQNKISETVADAFSLFVLRHYFNDQKSEKMFLQNKLPAERKKISFFQAWFEESLDMESVPLFKNCIPNKLKEKVLRNNSINFNSSLDRLVTPPAYANTLLFFVLIIGAYYAGISSFSVLILFSIFLVFAFIYMLIVFYVTDNTYHQCVCKLEEE